jgi:hypothetical protein
VRVTEIAFMVGPLFGVVLGPVAFVVHVVAAIAMRRTWPLWIGGTLLAFLALSTWVYWEAFWRDFGYADRNQAVPSLVQFLETTACAVAALACTTLLVSAVIAVRSRPA